MDARAAGRRRMLGSALDRVNRVERALYSLGATSQVVPSQFPGLGGSIVGGGHAHFFLMVAMSWSSAVAGWLIHWFKAFCRTRSVWITTLVVLAVLNCAVYLSYVRGFLNHNDFRLYYAGAQVGLRYGWDFIYDVKLHQAAVAALQPVGPWYALLTPPPITWLVAPLTALGYPAAYWVWVAVSLAILGAAVWYARPRQHSAAIYLIWWAALAPLWFSAYEGQVTIVAAAGLLVGWRLLDTRREFLGGLILAAALFKPYLVLLLPLALLMSGHWRALLGFATVAVTMGIGVLVTLHPDGIRGYLATLLAPQAPGDTAETLRSALGGSPAVPIIQALAVIAVIAVAVHARRTRATWPVVVAALLGSFLLAPYWHPQDYLALDVAAAITLAAGPLEAGLLVAAAAAIVPTPASPFSSHWTIVTWLLLATVFLGFLTLRGWTRPRPRSPSMALTASGR